MTPDDHPATTITLPDAATTGLTPEQVDELVEDLRWYAIAAANKIRASRN